MRSLGESPGLSRGEDVNVLRDLCVALPADLHNTPYEIHKLVYQSFCQTGARDFLYVNEDRPVSVMIVRSAAFPPELTGISVPVECPEDGSVRRFRLVATPSVSRRGGRTPLPKGDPLMREQWLHKQAARHGFEIVTLRGVVTRSVTFLRQGTSFWMDRTEFDGTLRVRDSAGFADALRTGVGRARAFGFGMLRTFHEESDVLHRSI